MFCALALAPLTVAAQQRGDRGSRDEAADRVRQVERAGGRVLQAEPMQRGGREVYRIKVLTPDGRVRVIDEDRGPGRRERPELTDRRREFRNDQGAEAARERQQRVEAERRERQREQSRERDDRREDRFDRGGGRGRRGD
ncbi:hypothetical protein P873_07825 [Arenimonas composti TR7-09 = DSM 18010]|uniref:PepSY domain-containing protein n=2 Tax=Arenimonas TaxID=490567 RepID=A0A091BFC6_9GAMM|nr:hypothetical protein P873_07825 [Arenimonas composti TR7-09 = DSM 18010]